MIAHLFSRYLEWTIDSGLSIYLLQSISFYCVSVCRVFITSLIYAYTCTLPYLWLRLSLPFSYLTLQVSQQFRTFLIDTTSGNMLPFSSVRSLNGQVRALCIAARTMEEEKKKPTEFVYSVIITRDVSSGIWHRLMCDKLKRLWSCVLPLYTLSNRLLNAFFLPFKDSGNKCLVVYCLCMTHLFKHVDDKCLSLCARVCGSLNGQSNVGKCKLICRSSRRFKLICSDVNKAWNYSRRYLMVCLYRLSSFAADSMLHALL